MAQRQGVVRTAESVLIAAGVIAAVVVGSIAKFAGAPSLVAVIVAAVGALVGIAVVFREARPTRDGVRVRALLRGRLVPYDEIETMGSTVRDDGGAGFARVWLEVAGEDASVRRTIGFGFTSIARDAAGLLRSMPTAHRVRIASAIARADHESLTLAREARYVLSRDEGQ